MISTEISYPRFQLASDHSLLVTFGEGISRQHHRDVVRLFKLLQREPFPAIRNIHPAYNSVLVAFDPLAASSNDVELSLRGMVGRIESIEIAPSRLVKIPVCYDEAFGIDLGFVAAHNALTKDEVVRYHTSAEYLVYFLGFLPGFPYLGDLSRQITAPRLPTPRLQIPAGSIAIGGNQAGIYPIESPGGWRIIGRTPLKLFEPLNDPPTLLEAGDLVRFQPVSVQEFWNIQNGARSFSSPRAVSMRALTVTSAGYLTTVQDLGRDYCAPWGISAAGAADQVSFRLGNLLVGNPPNTPALEMTPAGGRFQFEAPCRFALTGSDFGASLDGREVPAWQTLSAKGGQLLECGQAKSGARGYLCVGGGIVVPRVFSSASTHLLTALGGLNGRALKRGDVLEFGEQSGSSPQSFRAVRERILERLFGSGPILVTTGPQSDGFTPRALSLFSSSRYVVKEESNRMGLRLSGPPLESLSQRDMTTEGVSLGSVQVPPDGEPIILFVEHPTPGGYPKIANVISADLHRVGQLRPRDKVEFKFVTHEEAIARLREQESLLEPLRCLQPSQR
jgi:KipI family sensor histidine kinase inhibitor